MSAFKHEIDPSMGDDKAQQVLRDIHAGAGGRTFDLDLKIMC
jgi:hypothetical protein